MNELTATGGILIIGIAINLSEIKRIPLANLLCSLLIHFYCVSLCVKFALLRKQKPHS